MVDNVVNRKTAAAGSQHKKERDYWLSKLSGELVKSNFEVQNDLENPKERELEEIKFQLSNEIYERIMKISNNSDVRLLMILVTGLYMLIEKYTSNEDIIIGMPIFKQNEDTDFINTILPLRSEINYNDSFKKTLLKVKDVIFEACQNQNYPMNALLYQLGITYSDGQNPIFDIGVMLENIQYQKYLEEAKPNVIFSFLRTSNSIDGKLIYNSKLYSEEGMQKIATHYTNIIKEVMSNPNILLKDTKMLSEKEKAQILHEFNNTKKEYHTQRTIQELFENQVKLTPNNTAVVIDKKSCTYKELNDKANQLAKRLRESGVSSDTRVAIYTERSIEMIISMLAVLKSGGCYVPIDYEYPNDRIEFMLEDSEAELLLTQQNLIEKINFNKTIIEIDNVENYSGSIENLESISDENNLAYIIYTSGSTGKPKGVAVEHKSIINTLSWRKEYYAFTSEDAILQIPSFAFDSSVEDIFTALISGAKLVLLRQDKRVNLDYLSKVIPLNKVTNFLITPSFYKTLLSEIYVDLKSLKVVTIAGDSFSSGLVEEHFNKLKGVRLVNEYGPTENSVCTTVYEFTPENTEIFIGKPISNVSCYVISKDGNLCPIGVEGELCAAGKGVAREYLNNPEKTKDKFIQNPFNEQERMYKTGDLVKWLPDGKLSFVGRIDNQIKIRGFRVELGEIERKISNLDKIEECVVTAIDGADGNKEICAYFVSSENIDKSDLINGICEELPAYMIPAHFVKLEKFPLTNNGKINKKLLPKPTKDIEEDLYFEEPTNEIEAKLVEMWKDILSLDKVSINDNFFEVGGHSLRATILISRICKEFRVDIPLHEVFEKPTIKELSKYIDSSDKVKYLAIEKAEEREYYPVSSEQKRMYILNSMEGIGTTYNVPLGMEIEGELDEERVEKAINKLIERHESFRTSFEIVDGEPVQKINDDVKFNLKHVKVEESEIDEVAKSLVKPFNLNIAPLVNVVLISSNSKKKSILLFDMPHIISDGVSMNVFVSEFIRLYEGKELIANKIQYKDYTMWQKENMESDEILNQEKYWLNVFKDEIPVLNIPSDYPRPTVQTFEGDKVEFCIDENLTSKLKELASKVNGTLYMVLLAAYNLLLSKYTSQEDIVVGTPMAGRNHPDFENMVGMFVNTIAIRNYPSGEKKFIDFLEEVKNNMLSIYENQDYQFSDLVSKLNIPRDMSRNPIFDTMFIMQNMMDLDDSIDGIPFKMQSYESKIAKFDLAIMTYETDNKLEFSLQYRTKLFKAETIERMSKNFVNILNSIVEEQDTLLSKIQLITDEERELILNKFNNTNKGYNSNVTIKELFEEVVSKEGDKVAVVSNKKRLTYRELNEKSNQLANLLRSKNVKKGDIIPILCDKSIDIVVGMLAIIKSGAAYLPIDDECPESRIKAMIEDSDSKIMLVKNYQLEKLNLESLNIQLVNPESEEILKEDKNNLTNISSPDDLVYVIYTSGSTNKPKGVCLENRNLVSLVNEPDYLEIDVKDSLLQVGSLSFDASVFQIWLTLINGATLYLEDKSLVIDENLLKEYINSNNITVMIFPTPLFNKYCENNTEIFNNLKYVIVGGDILSSKQVSRIKKANKNITIINGYGPTENAVMSTLYTIKDSWNEEEVIPIGVPRSNSTAYIMDKNNNLQPIGVPGELCVGGAGLARGYLNRESLTSEKFIENPYVKGERIYKTGDLAKFLPDGNIEFLGRIDYQVKVNGVRIELQEVESQLLRYPKVKEAVVVANKDETGSNYLCAYVVCDEAINVKEVRSFLSKYLISAMIPNYIIQIEKMPVNISGKVDRKSLPKPRFGNEKHKYVEPVNEVEEKIAVVWEKVLGIEKISTDLNFFEIGGNSLKAISIVSRLSKELSISINDVFNYPTIHELAANVKTKINKKKVNDALDNREDMISGEVKKVYDAYIKDIDKYERLDLTKNIAYKNILLTGATGYVGINILRELMLATESSVYLIIRGKTDEEVERRIIDKMSFYFGIEFYDKYKERINVLKGDVAEENLGLSSEVYNDLLIKINCIINSAANVKHYGKYEEFYKINVLGTKNLLEFAKNGTIKDFNQISTLSVGQGNIKDKGIVLFTESDMNIGQESENVYIRSKLEAEKLVAEFSREVLNTKIFRLGNVMFNYESGKFQENIEENNFYNIIKSFINVKCVPDLKGKEFDLSYVDQLSKAIVLLFDKTKLNNNVFHIENPNKINSIELAQLLREQGFDIEIKSIDSFIKYIDFNSDDERMEEYINNIRLNMGEFEEEGTRIINASDRTNAVLRKIGFSWNTVNNEAVKRMISYCRKVKFL